MTNDHNAALADPLRTVPGRIGSSQSRLDGWLKVRGAARFAAEVRIEGLVYASIVHSTIARGRIREIKTAEAENLPGVILVMTYRNAPRLSDPPPFVLDPAGGADSSLPVMQDDQIHWNGEAVAVVVAESQEQADHAATLVKVSYQEVAARTIFEDLPPRMLDHVMGEPAEISIGDAEKALNNADYSIDHSYTTPRHSHCAIEPHAVTVQWVDGNIVVHDATQRINLAQSSIAAIFGISPDRVRVLSPFVGGGFGGKGFWSHQVLAIAAAKLCDRPVRLALSRKSVFRLIGGRTPTRQRVALGARQDGSLAALIHTGVTAMTPYNYCPEPFTFPARHLYKSDAMLMRQEVADMDMVANTFMRAPGESVGSFALECAIDEMAETLGLDPIEFRERIEPSVDPTSGRPFSTRNLLETYQIGARVFGWKDRSRTPRNRAADGWLTGMGMATATYPYYRWPGIEVGISIDRKGKIRVRTASHEMGMGTATIHSQYVADALGVPLSSITFEQGDSALPHGVIAGGSAQSATIIAGIDATLKVLVVDLLRLVGNSSPMAGLSINDVQIDRGGISPIGSREGWESFETILERSGRDQVESLGQPSLPTEMADYSIHSYGAQFCEVLVDEMTGEIRVNRCLGVFDTGRILNPKTALSQFKGGIVMGLGLALTEDLLFDPRNGRVVNASLADYHIPVHLDVPRIDVMWTGIPDPQSPFGIHGIGEIGVTGMAAAVANAVYNATGKRIRDLPITLDKLL